MAERSRSKSTICVALAGNLLIAATKFAAAAVTGSSAMLSEGVHSLVDTGNEILLLYGLHRSALPPDTRHPLGRGRELYFWSFVVALLVFALGAGVSFFEGLLRVLDPRPVENVPVSFIVLGLSAVFEGTSWWVAFKTFRARKGDLGFIEAAQRSKDPTAFTVLFEDSAALLGIAIAFVGIGAADRFGRWELDGFASMGISLVLTGTAWFLARESKSLLIGEPASGRLEKAILDIAGSDPAIHRANGVMTVHLAPDQIVVALSAEFRDEMTAPDIEACIEHLEHRFRELFPEITTLFVKPQATATWRRRRSSLEEASRPAPAMAPPR
jgi:cation diffusion facilitator family transporter